VRPLLRLTVALTWIASGIAGLVHAPIDAMARLISAGIPSQVFAGACVIDIAVGLVVLLRWRTGTLAIVQLALVVVYSAILSIIEPTLWLEPLGPLLKNLPFVASVLALAAIEQER
jgi:hypothetical protein